MDPLEPLEAHKGHFLYHAARDEVLTVYRAYGFNRALREAQRLARAFEDYELERKVKK